MEKAVELLKAADSTIIEVAHAVGYNSDKAFRRAFKKHKGQSPSDYRQAVISRRTI